MTTAPALPSLMPASRIERAANRRRRSNWATILLVYGVIVALVILPSMYRSGARYLADSDDAARLQASIDQQRAALAAANTRAETARARWQAAASLSKHPDWSVLFPFLARQLGGRATLASVRVNPNGGIDENAGYTVRLEGRTTDAANVSAIALDLERAGIFAEVVVEGSSRTADGGSAFTIRAPITTGSKDAAP